MEQEEKRKNIKEVFKDYNSNSFELNAVKIKNVTLYKKSSKMVLELLSEKLVKIADLCSFDKYLEERF